MPNRLSSAMRACSGLSSLKRISRPRISASRRQRVGQDEIAQRFQLVGGEQAVGAARIADDEHGLALLGRRARPGQMRGRRHGLAVLVKPHEREIEIVAREIEIVRIAAEERGLHFGREHQPHVGIFAVDVELVLAALIQADDLATVVGLAARRSPPSRSAASSPSRALMNSCPVLPAAAFVHALGHVGNAR